MLLFGVGIHSAAAPAEMPDFLLPASLLSSFLFPLFTQLPLSISAEANGCFKLQLSTEAVWPQFNHHAKPNSSSHFYFSEHGPEALK